MRRLCMFGGVVFVAFGGFLIFMTYGFASMIDPEIQGAARNAEIWHRMTTNGATPFGLGILAICVGVWLALRKPKPRA
jgi:hypothetical protein